VNKTDRALKLKYRRTFTITITSVSVHLHLTKATQSPSAYSEKPFAYTAGAHLD